MKQKDIEIGKVYEAKVSNKLTKLRVDDRLEKFYGGGRSRYVWQCTNLATGRKITVLSPVRFRRLVTAGIHVSAAPDKLVSLRETPAESPMMAAYREAKAQVPDLLLLFRIGDYFEALNDDAKTAARVLNLPLTSRGEIPMTGFPCHSLDLYLQKLISAGIVVAICEPVTDKPTIVRQTNG